jgi:hypothetical protein
MQERTGINNNTVGYNVIEMSGASFFVPNFFLFQILLPLLTPTPSHPNPFLSLPFSSIIREARVLASDASCLLINAFPVIHQPYDDMLILYSIPVR